MKTTLTTGIKITNDKPFTAPIGMHFRAGTVFTVEIGEECGAGVMLRISRPLTPHSPDGREVAGVCRVERGETMNRAQRRAAARGQSERSEPGLAEALERLNPEIRPLKVARRCPRCGAHRYHSVPMKHRKSATACKVLITCAECGHDWFGRLTKAERDIEE